MNLKSRKRWALVLLVVWMPLYIVLALIGMNWLYDRFGRAPILAEVILYVALGLIWVLPFRRVFLGIGKPGE